MTTVPGRRRRPIWLPIAAAVLAAVALTGCQARGSRAPAADRSHPVTGATAVAAPTRTVPASPGTPAAGTPLATLGLDARAGNVIIRPDGSRRVLDIPPEASPGQAWTLPSGWLLVAGYDGQTPELWYAPFTGRPVRLGRVFGDAMPSPDGTVAVATGVDGAATSVVAYALPSGRVLARTTFAGAMGPVALGVSGDWVLLVGAQGSPGPSAAAAWNFRTGALRRGTGTAWFRDVSTGGRTLRRVDRTGGMACVDTPALPGAVVLAGTGVCRADLAVPEWTGALSPGGTWAVLRAGSSGSGMVAVRAADLRAGRWRPVAPTLPSAAEPYFWITDTTLLTWSTPPPTGTRWARCVIGEGCRPVTMPAVYPDALPMARVGG